MKKNAAKDKEKNMTIEVNKNNIDVEGFSNGLKMTMINLLSNPQNKIPPKWTNF